MITSDLGILHIVSVPIDPHTESLGLLFEQLESALKGSPREGIGLAAVQISIPKQAFIIKLPKQETIRIWNPEIIEWGTQEIIHGEGCLSLPQNVIRSVARKTEVEFKNGDGRIYSLEGMEAIVFGHELAHCQGRLIIDEPIRNQKVGRNEPCKCGSGKKYKKCHGS